MVTESDDKWSYGLSAEPEPEEAWPPPAGLEAGPADPVRSSTGRWTSPSLGAYDPIPAAGADTTLGVPAPEATGLDRFGGPSLFEADESENGYFDEYGYGEDYGDGRLDASYGDDRGSDGRFAGPAAQEHTFQDPQFAGPHVEGEYGEAEFDADYDDDYDGYDEEDADEPSDTRRNAIEWAVVLVGAVLLALILRAVLLQAFWIPSPSMESTLLVKDRVLVNKISYRLHDINRGDVIVFRRTDAEIANNPELPRDVIKRVIGLSGETVAVKDNVVTIDGVTLLEPYLDEGVVTSDFGPEVVPEGHVFVMGDNRELSLDSRFETGPIAHDRVVGRAFFLFWPLDRLGSL